MSSVLRRWRQRAAAALLATACAAVSLPVQAIELINNGSFENNSGAGTSLWVGWFLASMNGSQGTFYTQTGVQPPFSKFVIQPPARGDFAVIRDQIGPGTAVLYQDIAVPASGQTVLSMRLFVQNQAEDYAVPASQSLDYGIVPNQQARVDIISPAANLLDVGAGVLASMYRTLPGDPQTQGYITLTQNLTPFAGTTVRLRLAAVDNLQGLNMAVDAVSTQLCDLDVDSDGRLGGTTDALLIIRQMLGLSGAPLTQGGVASSGAMANPTRVNSLVNSMRINGTLDIDGNGVIDSQSDGLLVLRAMLGMTGTAATNGALGNPPRTRNDWTAIRDYLNSVCGMNLP